MDIMPWHSKQVLLAQALELLCSVLKTDMTSLGGIPILSTGICSYWKRIWFPTHKHWELSNMLTNRPVDSGPSKRLIFWNRIGESLYSNLSDHILDYSSAIAFTTPEACFKFVVSGKIVVPFAELEWLHLAFPEVGRAVELMAVVQIAGGELPAWFSWTPLAISVP